jgi:hypothetical protein
MTRILRKLHWAELQRQSFVVESRAFFQDSPYRLRQESNADNTQYVIRATHIKAVPDHFGLRVGDIAHNLRSTLDHVAHSVARTPGQKTSFPIWHDESRDAHGRLIQPFIAGGTGRSVKRLLKESQPYFDGQDPDDNLLYLLRELDNIDKHRFVVTSAASQGASAHGFIPDPIGEWTLEPEWGKLESGDPVATFTFARPNPNIEIEYRPILAISVEGIATALDGQEISHALWQMHKAVRDTAKKFEPYLRR